MSLEKQILKINQEIAVEQVVPELAELLAIAQDYKVRTVLEIGSRFGGTLRCWLHILKVQTAIVVDKPVEEDPEVLVDRKLAWLSWLRPNQFLFPIFRPSKDPKAVQNVKDMLTALETDKLDMVFIDGGHTYDQVKFDYETYGPFARKIVAFHDITPSTVVGPEVLGVRPLWDQVKKDYQYLEIEKPKDDRGGYGIGVIFKENSNV